MKEKPIIFSPPMVRAILEGRKTQTRRVVKPNHMVMDHGEDVAGQCINAGYIPCLPLCPYGKPGDRLWVRETHLPKASGTIYRADFSEVEAAGLGGMYGGWKPSIHMPRWASRILLEIVRVRVERLKACNEVDAISEGAKWAACGSPQEGSHRAGFAELWESINGPGSWDANPWVWVVEFKVAKGVK